MAAWKQIRAALAGTAVVLATVQVAVADPEISGFAIVQENSALKLSGTLIYLYGIYVPPTEQSCYTFVKCRKSRRYGYTSKAAITATVAARFQLA